MDYVTEFQLQWIILVLNILVEGFAFFVTVQQFKVVQRVKWEEMGDFVKDLCKKEELEKSSAYEKDILIYLGFVARICYLLILFLALFYHSKNAFWIVYHLMMLGSLMYVLVWSWLAIKHGVVQWTFLKGIMKKTLLLCIALLTLYKFAILTLNIYYIPPRPIASGYQQNRPQNTTYICYCEATSSLSKSDLFQVFLPTIGFSCIRLVLTLKPVLSIVCFFFKYRPFKAGPLKTKIEKMATKLGFPVTKINVKEIEKDSIQHKDLSNFGMYNGFLGLIVLGGPWMDGKYEEKKLKEKNEDHGFENQKKEKESEKIIWNDEAILGVIAHELGHWKLNHSLHLSIILQFMNFLLYFLILQLPFWDISESFLVFPILKIFWFILMGFSQQREYEADAFAVDEGYGEGLKQTLINFAKASSKENQWLPVVDPLYNKCYCTHPTVLERIQAIDLRMEKKKGD